MENKKDVAIIGWGKVGQSYGKMFPEAVIYDEPRNFVSSITSLEERTELDTEQVDIKVQGRQLVNDCDLALVCVPTDSRKGQLDMSIVDDVVKWVETPLILIKSALQPGTVDRLVKETGKKIAVSVEMVGEGKYFVPYWKYPHADDPTYHNFLIVGGEEETARRCADFVWGRMSPDINIHLVSAVEAEITKMMENTWGAMKVTYANAVYDICDQLGANYTKVLQAWGADGRVEKMHMRVVPGKRGWKSKCYDKDCPAFANLDGSGFLKAMIKANRKHKQKNG